MPQIFFPFGSFSPGGSRFGEGLSEALNCVPLYEGYHPLGARVSGPAVADAPVTGCYAHMFPTGSLTSSYAPDKVTIFAGTHTKLYDGTAGAWTDLSRALGYGAAQLIPVTGDDPAGWRFASFGNDVWACNGFDPFQRRTDNTGLFANGPTSTFVPRPRFCGVVREFMVVADLAANGAGFSSDQFTWSDINDAAWYDDLTGARPASLSGGQNGKRVRSRPGGITGFTGGEYGVIYKRRSCHLLSFTGGGDTFRLDELSHGVGVALPGSLIQGRFGDYFFGGDGFYRRIGQSPPEKISPPSIDALFANPAYYAGTGGFYHGAVTAMSGEDALMVGFESARTPNLYWFYQGGLGAPKPLPQAVVFNPDLNAWSRLKDAASFYELARGIGLPASAVAQTDDVVESIVIFADDGNHNSVYCTLSGAPQEVRLTAQRQALSTRIDGSAGIKAVRVRSVLPVFTIPATKSTDGTVPTTPSVTIRLVASNDQHGLAQLDADGNPVSPRSQSVPTVATANDVGANAWGSVAPLAEGTWWDIGVTIPAGSYWNSFLGLWMDVDVIA